MKKSFRHPWSALALTALAAFGSQPSMAAPPANDDIANAVVVTQPLSFSSSTPTVEATVAADDPDCAGNEASVWYVFTPTVTGNIEANTVGSDYDTTLSAYTGAPGSLVQIACNDDATGIGRLSRLVMSVIAGTTYRFMAAAYSGSPGGHLVFNVRRASSSQIIAPYRVTDLGTLFGRDPSYALAINERSQIVGASLNLSGDYHAFLWDKGVMTDLDPAGGGGFLFSSPVALNNRGQIVGLSNGGNGVIWEKGVLTYFGTLGGSYTVPVALNDRGQVVGRSDISLANYLTHAFLWQNGVMTDLGTLGGSLSEATEINEGGQVVGWSDTTSGEYHAFLWQHGVMTDLDTLGGIESRARAINARGQVVGYFITASGEFRAFIWQNGVMTDLGTLGGSYTDAVAINEQGQVVGESATATGEPHAFLWENGVMTDLGTLGGPASRAVAINVRGQVIGASFNKAWAVRAFVWQGGVMTELEPLGDYAYATAINNQGQIVGNSGISEFDPGHAVLWTR